MASFQGSSADAARARDLTRQREIDSKAFQDRQHSIKQETIHQTKVRDVNDAFAVNDAKLELAFKSSTVGLLSSSEFQSKRDTVMREARAAEQAAKEQERERVNKLNETQRKSKMLTLSFAVENEEEEAEEEVILPKPAAAAASAVAAVTNRTTARSSDLEDERSSKRARTIITKNPDVSTSFLPDHERDAQEAALREKLKQEWLEQQERVKAAPITITYSFWTGIGHRKTTTMKKGDTIAKFLQQVHRELVPEFVEVRHATPDQLIFVKEDLMLPHSLSFYELIVSKARGKSGPLFAFDVRDDVRIEADARVEQQDTHAGKVCLRSWYEKNQRTFPASRWEPYEHNIGRTEAYTIHGHEVK